MPSRNRTSSFAAAAVVLSFVLLRPAAAAPPAGANDLLKQAVVADDRVSYTGTVTTLVYGPHGADATVVRVDHSAPKKWRMWYVAPADAYGRLIVSNETTTYQYEPKIATVYSDEWQHSAPALTLDLDTAKVLRNYSIDVGAASDVAGRKAVSLSLVSKYSGALVERVWLDDRTQLVLQRETYHADGTIDTKTSFDNIRIVNDLPKELFDLTVPAGMQVKAGTTFGKVAKDQATIQSGLDFTIVNPKYVPEGFSFDTASLASTNGIATAQLLYTDGLRDFSVFENSTQRLPELDSPKSIDIDDSTGVTDEIAGETLLSWNANGLNITLVGDLPAKQLARIGASVKP
jgi:outer membrane lipoprotein-sorting protein